MRLSLVIVTLATLVQGQELADAAPMAEPIARQLQSSALTTSPSYVQTPLSAGLQVWGDRNQYSIVSFDSRLNGATYVRFNNVKTSIGLVITIQVQEPLTLYLCGEAASTFNQKPRNCGFDTTLPAQGWSLFGTSVIVGDWDAGSFTCWTRSFAVGSYALPATTDPDPSDTSAPSNFRCLAAMAFQLSPPSSSPSPPPLQNGAIIEMTGDDPKLIFGTLDNPACQLSVDRSNSRLVSTCPIQDSRRLEETFDCEAKHAALEQKYEALQTEVSKLRGLVEKLAAKMN